MADSVGHTASINGLENLSNTRIKSVRAYSSIHDKRARWPEHNFTDVTNNALKNPGLEDYDALVLSAPTVDITNLDTSKLKPTDNTEFYQQEVILSSKNMFNLAQRCLKQNTSLKKVVVMEHPPRFDQTHQDPTSLKPTLVSLANSTLNKLWLNSSLKDKIVIGHHCLENVGTGAAHFNRYKDMNTGRYDGVHLYGRTGSDDYTMSVHNILVSALPQATSAQQKISFGTTQQDNHQNCPQAKYQKHGKVNPTIVTKNRFSVLNSNQKNY